MSQIVDYPSLYAVSLGTACMYTALLALMSARVMSARAWMSCNTKAAASFDHIAYNGWIRWKV
jgi:hypothetical protein